MNRSGGIDKEIEDGIAHLICEQTIREENPLKKEWIDLYSHLMLVSSSKLQMYHVLGVVTYEYQ
ncbi:hypothetical protein ccbrp13_43320 [Ktedonobacteria bacterium brp13]|nr:hypothetical protein ccbrp13_43320 [Ktedonobacteria bacterium brp13]